MTKSKRNVFRFVIKGCLFISVALYFISMSYRGLSTEYVESDWKETTGVVLSPTLQLAGFKNSDRVRQGFEQTINYQYSVDGQTYQSNSVSRELFVELKDYPEGKKINVYYNPSDVEDSILIRTKVQKQYLYALMAFCIFMIGVILYLMIKELKRA